MGCCGCDNRTSATTAGIFSFIQSVIGFILAIYNLRIFYVEDGSDMGVDKIYLRMTLYSVQGTIRGLLVVALLMYIAWGISAVLLLIGNTTNRYALVLQAVIVSIIVIVLSFIMPAVFLGVSMSYVTSQFDSSMMSQYSSYYNLTWNYIVLMCTFNFGSLITWICNIALTVYTSHRARDIRSPPQTFIHTVGVPVGVPTMVIPGPQTQYYQPGVVSPPGVFPQQQGYFQQSGPYQQPLPYQPQFQVQNQVVTQHPQQFQSPEPGEKNADNLNSPTPTYQTREY